MVADEGVPLLATLFYGTIKSGRNIRTIIDLGQANAAPLTLKNDLV